jgi:hypothetical protein
MSVHDLEGSPIEIFTMGEFMPERRVECAWSSRFNEAAALDDLEYPFSPGCGSFPKYIHIEPMSAQTNAPGNLASYEKAIITIKYTSQLNTNGAIIEWIEGSDIHSPCKPEESCWSDGQIRPAPDKPFVLRSGGVFNHVRLKLGAVPTAVITQVDYVNNAAAYSQILGITFLAETLRAQMPRVQRTWTVSGLTSFYVHQRFSYCSNGGLGWNSAYRADTGTYEYVCSAAGARLRDYPITSFVLA